jgi:hypothetical protein
MVDELEKIAEKKEKKTYPVSRFLTHPGGAAITGAAVGASSPYTARELTMRLIENRARSSRFRKAMDSPEGKKGIKKMKKGIRRITKGPAKSMAVALGLAGGAAGAGGATISRFLHERAQKGRETVKKASLKEARLNILESIFKGRNAARSRIPQRILPKTPGAMLAGLPKAPSPNVASVRQALTGAGVKTKVSA